MILPGTRKGWCSGDGTLHGSNLVKTVNSSQPAPDLAWEARAGCPKMVPFFAAEQLFMMLLAADDGGDGDDDFQISEVKNSI